MLNGHVLIERERLLGELVALSGDALAGSGRLVFVGGEAGVGKTALTRAFAETLGEPWTRRVGTVDNVTTADALAAFREAVPELEALLDLDATRMRVLRALRGALAPAPTLLILEDLQWADEATLDALRFLGRRLDGLPVVAVATYRHDEVSPRHPLSTVMGDLAGLPEVRRLVVPPLTVDGVAQLAAGAGVAVDAVLLHARTGGNAFYVTEVLAGGAEQVPATVRDAVMGRVGRLSPAASDVTAAAAVLGVSATADLLTAVSGRSVAAVDECTERGVLVGRPSGYTFRHELARQAVEASLSAVRRRALHRRALRELSGRTPDDHRALAHHAAGCGDEATAVHHATLAAEHAARLGAHREAAAQYRMALRGGGAHIPERAALFEALSYECYLTDQLPEALAARQRALELHELADERAAAGDAQRWMSRLSWYLGRNGDSERYAALAVRTLSPLGDSHELGMAYSTLAQLRMLAHDEPGASDWGARALALAQRLDDHEVEIHALNNTGTAVLQAGRIAEGSVLLARSLDLALASDAHEHAARAYTNLGSAAVEQRRYAEGLRYLDAGIAYCEERDLDSWSRYMQAWVATALGETGDWDRSVAVAEHLLGHHDLAPVTVIPAAVAASRIAERRGEDGSSLLSLAATLANGTNELQRIGAVAFAAAESAWLAGRTDQIEELTQPAWELAVRHTDRWALGELAWWRSLVGLAVDEAVAPPFQLLVDGRWQEAAETWSALGSRLWAAYALALAPDAAPARSSVALLDSLGAPRAVEAVLRTRRDRGLPLPRRPRAVTRANEAGLTARELDVLRAAAAGLSTNEIADRLVLSRRTVEHHVASILRKLGTPTRARAVVAARERGLLDGT